MEDARLDLMKPNLPPWLKIKYDVIQALDTGSKFKPLTQDEIDVGVVARGPIVAAEVKGTAPETKNELPALCHNVGFFFSKEDESWYMFHDSSPMQRRHIRIDQLITVNRAGELIVSTRNHGLIRYRKFKVGDKSLYAGNFYDEYDDADEIVRAVWRNEWMDGRYGI